MAQLNAQAVTDAWANKMATAGPAYKAGIQNLSENPMAKAAASSDRMLSGVQAAVQSGKWANSLNKVNFQDWKQTTASKGADRLATGATAAKPKMLGFMTKWLPAAAGISATVNAMPKGTREAAMARVGAAYDAAKQFAQSNN